MGFFAAQWPGAGAGSLVATTLQANHLELVSGIATLVSLFLLCDVACLWGSLSVETQGYKRLGCSDFEAQVEQSDAHWEEPYETFFDPRDSLGS